MHQSKGGNFHSTVYRIASISPSQFLMKLVLVGKIVERRRHLYFPEYSLFVRHDTKYFKQITSFNSCDKSMTKTVLSLVCRLEGGKANLKRLSHPPKKTSHK